MRNVLILLAAVFLTHQALAGHAEGNGGGGVVCRDNRGDVISVRLLDFYESEIIRPQVKIDVSGKTTDEIMAFVISRLRKTDKERADLYQQRANKFLSQVNWTHLPLAFTDDIGKLPFETDCRVEQIVNQSRPWNSFEKRFLVQRKLWDHLDPINRAGFILHEAIYREAIARGLRNSREVRVFNSLIFSGLLEAMSPTQYLDVLSDLRFDFYRWYDEEMKQTWVLFPKSPIFNSTYFEAGEACREMGGQLPGSQHFHRLVAKTLKQDIRDFIDGRRFLTSNDGDAVEVDGASIHFTVYEKHIPPCNSSVICVVGGSLPQE